VEKALDTDKVDQASQQDTAYASHELVMPAAVELLVKAVKVAKKTSGRLLKLK